MDKRIWEEIILREHQNTKDVELRRCLERAIISLDISLVKALRKEIFKFSAFLGGPWIFSLFYVICLISTSTIPLKDAVPIGLGFGIVYNIAFGFLYFKDFLIEKRYSWLKETLYTLKHDNLYPFLSRRLKGKRPSIAKVEEAINKLWEYDKEYSYRINTQVEELRRIINQIDLSLPIENYIKSLNSISWQKRFLARHALCRYGGEGIQHLLTLEHQHTFSREPHDWLIKNIAETTRVQFSMNSQFYVCPNCLTRFSKHKISISAFSKATYYGCGICYQSRKYELVQGKIIAILDDDIIEKYILESDNLIVNWLLHRQLFDFDQVEIINATDKDVEQFCIQVGNDTDKIRHPKYKKMECAVKCKLDQNTIRILENTFGKIIYEADHQIH